MAPSPTGRARSSATCWCSPQAKERSNHARQILSGGGLGFSIAYAYNDFDSQTMYALMMFVLVIAVVMNGALHVWEQRMLRKRARA